MSKKKVYSKITIVLNNIFKGKNKVNYLKVKGLKFIILWKIMNVKYSN